MEVALYHPEHGYYRKLRSPFGPEGDFYTAEQMQPVFGRIVAQFLRALAAEAEMSSLTVVELGAGRADLKHALAEFRYIPVDIGYGELPDRIEGVVFTNEFFDVVPIDLLVRRGNALLQRRVGFESGRFAWVDGPAISSDAVDAVPDEEDGIRETQGHRVEWLRNMAERLASGFIVTIDYGYTSRERIRFPQGTLMSYHRHQASDDVLADPGLRDITAHVDFTALRRAGEQMGLETIRFESLASMILRTGEADQFAEALAAATEAERTRYALQLKSLLFGMGETFRVLVQKKGTK